MPTKVSQQANLKLFKNRPFIWHLWDGRKDGLHALVNYHLLDNAALQKLTYSYLGNWIRQQDADAKAESDALLALQEWALGHYPANHRFTAGDICELHRRWLGDIYVWAGEYRTVNLEKGASILPLPYPSVA